MSTVAIAVIFLIRMILPFGLLIALGTTHFVSSFLYGISPIDPTTFAAVSAILAAVALVASFIPARNAAQMNPMDAMRYE